jgi:hypothetical protein
VGTYPFQRSRTRFEDVVIIGFNHLWYADLVVSVVFREVEGMQCSRRGHYIGKGFERSVRLVYIVNAAVDNRSVLRNVPSPVLVTTSLVGISLLPYDRQSIAEVAQSSNALI